MPDTTGLGEGATWNGTMLDGRPVNYTIPKGNGNNTVDLEITNKNGTKDHWRIARNELGGLQHWHDDADGNSSYAYRATAETDWNFQRFDPGVSTSGAPSGELGATPDLHTIFTPSFDSDGNRVGIDIAKLNRFGKYDNYHVDNYGNLTITSYHPDGKGGFESVFVNQFDRDSWRFGEDGEVWEIGKDLQGHPTAGRTYETPENRHVLYINYLGELFDSVFGFGKSPSYTARLTTNGDLTRAFKNGPTFLYDKSLRELVLKKSAPDHRDFLQRSRDAADEAWDNAVKSGGNWFAETFGIKELGKSYNSALINAPYHSPTEMEMWAKFGGGIADLGHFAVDSYVYPYLTVAEWSGRQILATAYNLRASFGHGEGGTASAQTAQKLLEGSPSNAEAALSAGMLLLPHLGPAARGLGIGFRFGGRVLGDGIAIAKYSTMSTSRSLVRIGSALVDQAALSYERTVIPAIYLTGRNAAVRLRKGAENAGSALGKSDADSGIAQSLTASAEIAYKKVLNSAGRIARLIPLPSGPASDALNKFNSRVIRPPTSSPRPATLPQISNGATRKQLVNYRLPAEMAGPEVNLSGAQFALLSRPYVNGGRMRGALRPFSLKPNTKYVYTDYKGRRTIVVTSNNGSPKYVEGWGSDKATVPFGKSPDRNPILQNPLPNVVYKVNSNFWLRTDMYGRVVEGYNPALGVVPANLRLRVQSEQSGFNRRRGLLSRGPTQAGHIFGNEFGSPSEKIFYTHQLETVNESPGPVYMLERAMSRYLHANPGTTLEYSVLVEYSQRPAITGWRTINDERLPTLYHVGYSLPGLPWMSRLVIPNA
ncbi:DNA/RNA non-specific endonuclease [Nocardia tengchongensis]